MLFLAPAPTLALSIKSTLPQFFPYGKRRGPVSGYFHQCESSTSGFPQATTTVTGVSSQQVQAVTSGTPKGLHQGEVWGQAAQGTAGGKAAKPKPYSCP